MTTPTLRPYQQTMVSNIRAAFADGAGAVVAVAPTGAGKTVVFSFVAASAAAQGTRTVVLVHRDALLRQTARALSSAGVAHGLIAAGTSPSHDLVQVASVQTLARRLIRYPNDPRYRFSLLVVDEAHHAVAGSWLSVIDRLPDAHVLGVTATPRRLDGRGLDGVFRALVLGPSIAELVADGWLAPARVYAPATRPTTDGVTRRAGDFDRGELAELMDTPSITGDAVDHYRRLCPGSPAVAFCVSVRHAEDVAATFAAAGFPSRAISGRMPVEEIRRATDALSAGDLAVLTSCDLISEGFDCPAMAAAILLRPTQSEALFVQQIGRPLRPVFADGHDLTTRAGRLAAIAAGDKPSAIILDHAGNVFRHGMPDDDREWTLAGRPRRVGTAPAVGVRQCSRCFACHSPAPVCPACGFVYPPSDAIPETRAGELEEVNAVEVRRIRRERIRRARTLPELHALASELGYRPAWASILYQQRGGR